ncbi:splicing factor 3B subunit 3 [Carex littledalei]|uniref:Splicing factor 3B subunit 3 n=1 Tax=Carex littledalei TaxID=544730 RepID=A0A833VGA5_9POAL|nr:splicing factor 3B subunit 3 [Carex littledalei]
MVVTLYSVEVFGAIIKVTVELTQKIVPWGSVVPLLQVQAAHHIFADDMVPRWLTAAHLLTLTRWPAGVDKFGNIYFARLPQDTSDEIEEDSTGGRMKWEQGKMNGSPNKVE